VEAMAEVAWVAAEAAMAAEVPVAADMVEVALVVAALMEAHLVEAAGKPYQTSEFIPKNKQFITNHHSTIIYPTVNNLLPIWLLLVCFSFSLDRLKSQKTIC